MKLTGIIQQSALTKKCFAIFADINRKSSDAANKCLLIFEEKLKEKHNLKVSVDNALNLKG